MGAIDKHIVEANVKLQDENNVLKDDKRILNLKIEDKEKVINDLLSRIATLEYEVEELQKENDLDYNLNKSLLKDIDKAGKEIERLNNIINELEKYLIKIKETSTPQERIMAKFVLEYIKILKGEELEVRPYDELDEILELEKDNLELKGSDEE